MGGGRPQVGDSDFVFSFAGKDVLHLQYADVAPLLLLAVADLPLLLKDAGIRMFPFKFRPVIIQTLVLQTDSCAMACVSYRSHCSCPVVLMKYLKFYELLTNFQGFPKGCISCFTGLLPHHPVVDLHPPDDILPLSNVATALHLCLLRRGNCLTRP